MPTIPLRELHIDTARSGGPGGQNVNKVETKVQLRWHIGASRVFSLSQKYRLRHRLANKINDNDEIMVDVDEERSQTQNKAIAIARLGELVNLALLPTKHRRQTKPTKASRERRLKEKKQVSQKKQKRKKARYDEIG